MTERAEPDPSTKGVVGIQNMGNTCYCNTTLQLLRASPEWTVYCLTEPFENLTQHLPDEDKNKRMLLAYRDILQSLWSAHRPAYVRPLGFLSEVCKAVQGTVYEMFGLAIPNDSHEYLVYLLDHFHEALKQRIPWEPIPIPEEISAIESMRIRADNAWNQFVSVNQSELVKLFFGMLQKTVTCQNCNNHVYQWDFFNALKVPCEGQTIQEWIRNEVNNESEIEDYKCDHCKGRHKAMIRLRVWKLPPQLFLTFKRFLPNGQKNMTQCPYQGDPLTFHEFYAEESLDPQRHAHYELRGISDHHGTHMGGHYNAQFKHPLTNQWWVLDDEQSRPLTQPMFSPSNYILFYRTM